MKTRKKNSVLFEPQRLEMIMYGNIFENGIEDFDNVTQLS